MIAKVRRLATSLAVALDMSASVLACGEGLSAKTALRGDEKNRCVLSRIQQAKQSETCRSGALGHRIRLQNQVLDHHLLAEMKALRVVDVSVDQCQSRAPRSMFARFQKLAGDTSEASAHRRATVRSSTER